MHYYLLLKNEQCGPYTLGQLRTMWQSGAVTADTLFWQEGRGEDWAMLSCLAPELDGALIPSQAASAPIQVQVQAAAPPKERGRGLVVLFRLVMFTVAACLFIVGVMAFLMGSGSIMLLAFGIMIFCLFLAFMVKGAW